MPRQQHGAQNFLRSEQMVDISAGIMATGGTTAHRIDGAVVFFVAGVPHIQSTLACKCLSRSARTRRHDAIEHVYAAQHGTDDIGRSADPH